jgi:hypothetical protein
LDGITTLKFKRSISSSDEVRFQRLFFWFMDCGNPITSKIMMDWKIQTDLTRVTTIQYDAVGKVLDCFYTSEEAWIFKPLD